MINLELKYSLFELISKFLKIEVKHETALNVYTSIKIIIVTFSLVKLYLRIISSIDILLPKLEYVLRLITCNVK